jgi:ABC-type Na+ transport system ATPase subunit NatA
LAPRGEPFAAFGVNPFMLAVQRLTKHYGSLTAIQDVSFEVRPGEVLGLLGPNGSGKSTTVKILTGLLRPSGGSVMLDGRDALATLQDYKRLIGFGEFGFDPLYPSVVLGVPFYCVAKSLFELHRGFPACFADTPGWHASC